MVAVAVAANALERVELAVTGMTCAGCASRIRKGLAAVPGVSETEVNLALERASVAFDPARVTPSDLARTVEAIGYGVRSRSLALRITGMSCASCAGRVERALAAVPGVLEAHVDPVSERASVRLLDGAVGIKALLDAVAAAGYGAVPEQAVDTGQAAAAEASEQRRQLTHLLAAAALTLPLVAPMLLRPFGLAPHLPPWLELVLATPVQFWLGARFYHGAWRALRARAGNMDQLVALGTTAAFAYSLWLYATLGHHAAGRLYVEGSAAVITLVLLGKWLEARTKQGASAALRELMALRPQTARIMRAGAETEVAVEEVAEGDIVTLRAGERVPVDGIVIEGASELDEALVTGESLPVAKALGAAVIAGSVNGAGYLQLRATRVGQETTLSRIARLVEQAQNGRTSVQRLADAVSGVFVPVVILIALLTLAGWLLAGGGLDQAVGAAVAVLVIACPCALGLATPAALVAGTGAAAKAGILIRDLETLERAHALTMIAFDKTGTLTIGRPEVLAVRALDGDEAGLLRLAAAAQAGSDHPLGHATVRAAEERGLAIPRGTGVAVLAGLGVEAVVEAVRIRVGRDRLLADAGIEIGLLAAEAAAQEGSGRTLSWVAADGRLLGFLVFADQVRPESAQAVQALRAMGLEVLMLSGDNAGAAAAIAGPLGISQVLAPVRPEEKAARLQALQAQGQVVAMVGDGINDAPALAAADVGIAVGTGSDVALATAGLTLMRPDPRLVAAAIEIARATRAKIRQNLAWAFAYNIVALPLAALGLLSPAIAGAAMAMSSVSVVTNALLLRRWRPRA